MSPIISKINDKSVIGGKLPGQFLNLNQLSKPITKTWIIKNIMNADQSDLNILRLLT